jgi:DivIVA domain-containing protein
VDLTHQSITNQQFELNRRGYDPDAVDAHLGQIAAAVAERERHIAELERTVASMQETLNELQAKVQDANESEEALRLTLKAAAHAKEELLAGARNQAETMQREAEERAADLVRQAEANAHEAEARAHARAEAITSGASARAQDVARAALAESELLVARIEGLRRQLAVAEEAVHALSTEAEPRLAGARAALDDALNEARATADNPELLAAAAPVVREAVPEPRPEPISLDDDPGPPAAEPIAAADPTESRAAGDVPKAEFPDASIESERASEAPQLEVVQPVAEVANHRFDNEPFGQASPSADSVESDHQDHAAWSDEPSADEPSGDEPPPAEPALSSEQDHAASSDEAAAAPAESTTDISDKVDRLLEELREVT